MFFSLFFSKLKFRVTGRYQTVITMTTSTHKTKATKVGYRILASNEVDCVLFDGVYIYVYVYIHIRKYMHSTILIVNEHSLSVDFNYSRESLFYAIRMPCMATENTILSPCQYCCIVTFWLRVLGSYKLWNFL